MFFTINLPKQQYTNYLKARLLRIAKMRILTYKSTAAEVNLNKYLVKEYKKSLKTICINLVSNCDIMQNGNDEFVVLFKNQKQDQLASLITYGNEKLKGSNILKAAFK